MLGRTLDYLILRPLTHDRNSRTEEELDADASHRTLVIEDAISRVHQLMDRLEGHLPISSRLRYLDIGCGTGDIAIALAKLGCKNVTGVDFVPRAIAQAIANAGQSGVDEFVTFTCQDIHRWTPPTRYDVILSHESLEHISDPQPLLQKIASLVTPSGIAILAFGPLFHSPFGDHMEAFFRVPIPWRGALFSEEAILRLRRERFRPTDPAERYRDISGGLSLMRYSEFLKYVDTTGWAFDFLRVNPQLKSFPILQSLSNTLIRLPVVKDYFAASIYAILRRRVSPVASGLVE
jgi:2-polyprenyl-3-methyl-5-hydroxy-6-metoxy-1,4-benzoquinol methylase